MNLHSSHVDLHVVDVVQSSASSSSFVPGMPTTTTRSTAGAQVAYGRTEVGTSLTWGLVSPHDITLPKHLHFTRGPSCPEFSEI